VSAPFRISISATFTAEPLETVLRFWGEQLEAHFEIVFAPFGQVVQTLLNPAGEFATNRRGVNVVLVRTSDLGVRALENAAQIAGALKTAAARDACPLIFVLCPSESDAIEAENRLLSALPGRTLDYREVDHLYPVKTRFDASADHLGAIPYTSDYFAALGTALARRITGLSLVPYKVIAVDCDNTLWNGICGEDGPAGVVLDDGRRALQQFLLKQRDAGMLLVLASKNNLGDVWETFAQHPEMPLQLEHFSASRVNWEPKPGNLASMAKELSLGLDSFLFLDDSAKECAEMREEQPQVLTLELPAKLLADPARTQHFLDHVWAFDHALVTDEDRKRADSYTQGREFGQAFRSAHSLEEFMASLDLRVEIAPVTEEQLPRVAQLTQRTNQFNFTTIRRSEPELRSLLATKHECLTAKVADRFGEHGLTGAILFTVTADSLQIDSFLLSCRVLGRSVEHRLMAHLGKLAIERGLRFVDAGLAVTAKNQPALQFLRAVGSQYEKDLEFRFPAEYLSNLRWKPQDLDPVVEKAPVVEQHRFLPFEKIARELASVEDIVRAMRGSSIQLDTDLSGTEAELATIWADLLKVPKVGPDDRFFDLGGHSLLAVLLISRVQDRLGVTLPVDDVYSGDMTLRDLAMKIDALGAGGMDSAEYDAMLAEIESLSDDEVRALLGQQ
jgi:FkbH-like protein